MRTKAALLVGVLALWTGLSACGGDSEDDDSAQGGSAGTALGGTGGSDGGTGGSTGGSAGSGGSGGGDTGGTGGSAVQCPSTVPADGSACDYEGLVCQFGDYPLQHCLPKATCTSGSWSVDDPQCGEWAQPANCPASIDQAVGECSPDGTLCAYDGLVCNCTNCTEGPAVQCVGPSTWRCATPHSDPNCPTALPNLGSPCDHEGYTCEYGCLREQKRLCENGVWVETGMDMCPISTRRAKRNIAYLSDAELEQVARDLMRIRLATYEYIKESLPRGEQLGFIIEDSPDLPAVDRQRSRVNIYGYASMLLATVQVQNKRIEQLERQIHELSRKVEQQPKSK